MEEQFVAELSAEILARQQRGYLAIDDDGVLRHCGGSLDHYGPGQLECGRAVLDQLGFLHGLVPLESTEYLHLPVSIVGDRRQGGPCIYFAAKI